MENALSTQEIEVVVSKEEYFRAETIIFIANLHYSDQKSLDEKSRDDQKLLLGFFDRNEIEIIKTTEGETSYGDFSYKLPAYNILLNHDQYLLLEKYRDHHPELGGIAIKPEFSKQDKDKLLHEITVQAWREADEIAIKKGLVLKNEYKSEEVTEKKSSRVIGAPASARYDHFKQPLSATYKFIFKTL